jgi:hypothetical protein
MQAWRRPKARNESSQSIVMILYGSIVLYVLSIVACHYIAKRRGAKPVFWGFMGAMFGPFAIPFAFFARPEN